MIFFPLPMVGQVFCFCHQWWVTSSDFLFFTPNWGGGATSNDVFLRHQWGSSFQLIFFSSTNGGSLQVTFFFTANMGSIQVTFFFTPNRGHFKCFFFGHQWRVTSNDFFTSQGIFSLSSS